MFHTKAQGQSVLCVSEKEAHMATLAGGSENWVLEARSWRASSIRVRTVGSLWYIKTTTECCEVEERDMTTFVF